MNHSIRTSNIDVEGGEMETEIGETPLVTDKCVVRLYSVAGKTRT